MAISLECVSVIIAGPIGRVSCSLRLAGGMVVVDVRLSVQIVSRDTVVWKRRAGQRVWRLMIVEPSIMTTAISA